MTHNADETCITFTGARQAGEANFVSLQPGPAALFPIALRGVRAVLAGGMPWMVPTANGAPVCAPAGRGAARGGGMPDLAVAGLGDDPYPPPPEGFHRGRYHRLRAGAYRIMYMVDENVITIERVDRLTAR